MNIFPVLAANMSSIVGIYNTVKGIFTLACAVSESICLVGIMVSRSQKTISDFQAWQTRIFISWIVFMGLGLLVNWAHSVVDGATYEYGKIEKG